MIFMIQECFKLSSLLQKTHHTKHIMKSKVLIILHSDELNPESYRWAVDVMKLKYEYDFDLTISSKWGIDLYHFMIYLDCFIQYDKDLFRSIKYLRHEENETIYDIVGHIYNDKDIENVIGKIYESSSFNSV